MVHSLLTRLFDVRPGELRRVGSMSALLGLIIATSYILKPVRNSVFLTQYGAQNLPYVYVVVAVAAGLVSIGFARLVARYYLKTIFVAAVVVFAATLAVSWWAIQIGWSFAGFALYVWVGIYTTVMPALFWLTANYVFYSNEARRLFGLLSAGGVLGSIVGGVLTSTLVKIVGTPALLLAAAVVLLSVGALTAWIDRRERDRILERRYDLRRQKLRRIAGREEAAVSLVARSRHLKLITLLTVVTIVTSTLVDYQFNSVAEESFRGTDDLTGFFGTFFALINVVAFLLQLLVSGRILSRLGVGAGLVGLPLMLLAGSLGFMASPGLLTVAALKACDDGLSHSLNRSSVEILWLPISIEVKNRTKAWLDMFVDRVSRGLGGSILFVAAASRVSVGRVSGVVMVLVALWLGLVLLLKQEYVTAFRRSITRRDIDVGALTEGVQDQHSLTVLRQVLAGSDEKQILYALDLLRGTTDESVTELVVGLLSHPSTAVRAGALRLLGTHPRPRKVESVAALTMDEAPEVSAMALELVLRLDPALGRERLSAVLASGETARIHAVFNCMEDGRNLLEGVLDENFLRRYHRSPVAAEREVAARTAGFLATTPQVLELLSELLRDPSTPVARAAAASAARLRHDMLIPDLIQQLSRRPLRAAARGALARFSPEVTGHILTLLDDRAQDPKIRRALPLVLVEFGDQSIVADLLARLPQADIGLHFQMIRALGKMRTRYPRLRFPVGDVDRILDRERREYGAMAGNLVAILRSGTETGAGRLLVRALEERLGSARERVFRLLALIYPPNDIFNAWNRISHGRPAVRAAAWEFLANLLSAAHRDTVLPLVEASSWVEVMAAGRRLFGLQEPGFESAVTELVRGNDPWLGACAVTLAGDLALEETRDTIASATAHPDPLVREAARSTLERLARSADSESGRSKPHPVNPGS